MYVFMLKPSPGYEARRVYNFDKALSHLGPATAIHQFQASHFEVKRLVDAGWAQILDTDQAYAHARTFGGIIITVAVDLTQSTTKI